MSTKTYNCLNCGVLNTDRKNVAGKYCDNKCQHEHQYRTNLLEWFGNRKKVGIKFVRRYLVETFGENCSVCKLNSWMEKPLPLQVDHADGDPYNNRPNNLRLVCPNCHSQTDSFGAKNKGSGRKLSLNKNGNWLLEKVK